MVFFQVRVSRAVAPLAPAASLTSSAVRLQKELTKTVVIHPRFLGKKLRKTVVETLKADVVGSCIDGAHVIAVLRIADDNISRGTIEPLTGSVRYDVVYRAIMFRPFKNEILDCVVKQVTEVRCRVPRAHSHQNLVLVVNSVRAAGLLRRRRSPERVCVASGAWPLVYPAALARCPHPPSYCMYAEHSWRYRASSGRERVGVRLWR